ncbi:presenilins-associated rhomboid-like protein, mitochondrial [Fopius arisanus]|uniref:rhomboid protease n=1 Tax=Fopius arisanus TaxID=64838 RepID=A0A9R1TPQ6_9HYME|nr:PREDICTED: presenilins-associated rhomboid-like protein, mitochondrial [Fopius arisanus]
MALRTILWLGETPGKCLFTRGQGHRTLLEVPNTSRWTRGFKRLRAGERSAISEGLGGEIQAGGQLWKPLGFTILFGGAVHIGATIWEYERVRSHAIKVKNRFQQWRVNRTGWRGEMETWWRGLSESQRVFAPICFLNVVVFLGWRIPSLKNTMVRYFCSNPSSKAVCWPMLLSTFSHSSALHLGVNMYVLYSFGTMAIPTLGREQFVALYLTSGVVSNLASHLYKIALGRPGLSLGASGAIMGTVSYICMQYPDLKVAIVFLPMFGFTAGYALKGLLTMDTLGCVLGWRFFDHAAHLGGALWGIFWHTWGSTNLWQKRDPVLMFWHSFRDPKKTR